MNVVAETLSLIYHMVLMMHKTYEMDGDFIEPLADKKSMFDEYRFSNTDLIALETTGPDDLGWRSFASQKVVAQLRDRVKELEETAIEMFTADEEYGCGYYGQSSWTTPYDKLAKLTGYERGSI